MGPMIYWRCYFTFLRFEGTEEDHRLFAKKSVGISIADQMLFVVESTRFS